MKKKPNHEILFFLWKRRKILLTMKLLLCFFLFSMLNVSGSIFSQSATFDLAVNGKTVKEVFKDIESQSQYRFLYNDDFAGLLRVVSFNTTDNNINEVLGKLLAGAHLTYRELENDLIVITPMEVDVQQRTVSGNVTDRNNVPLPGVTVVVKGTTLGTVTDVDGNYSLTNIPDDATLEFSFVGLLTQELVVGDQMNINVTMEEDAIGIDEVVAVGYGTMRRSHLTGSVGSVRMDETLESRPVGDFGQVMYGKVAGVQILNTTGRPGQDSRIQIRGVNSISAGSDPLIVIDGVIMPGFNLNTINSSDIESIEILKDAASAAIYGSRAANGVILVTTKSGTPGEPSMSFNYSYTSQRVVSKVDMMNGPEYAQAAIDAAQNGWIDRGGDPNAPNTIEARGQYKYTWPETLERPETLWDTDFQDLIYRVAPMHRANLSFSGGDEKTTHYLSVGVVNQTGIVEKSEYQKYTLNMKADTRPNNWLTVGGMLNIAYDYEQVNQGNVVQGAVQYPSIYPEYGNNGYLGGPNSVDGFENHYGILIRAYNSHPYHWNADNDYRNTLNSAGNLFAEIDILSNLKYRSAFSTFLRRYDRRLYVPGDTGLATTRPARAESWANQSFNYNFENTLTYNYILDNHQIDAVAGYEFSYQDGYNLNAQRREYDNDLVEYLSSGNLVHSANDGASEYSMISLFGRLNYNYLGKYMFSATLRRDGSSRFGPGNKWGNFPSVSAGWRISEERFMENVDIVSNLNIRTSYGITGNDNFGNYLWVSSMSQGRIALGNNLYTTYYPSGVMNPDLAWERTIVTNIGLDIGLVNNRFILGADFYKSESDGLLLNVPVPSTSGFTSVFRNIGAMESEGVELTLTTRNLAGELGWNTNVTFARNQSTITKLGPDDSPMILRRQNMDIINQIGEAPFSFYAYQYDGVYMNQAEIDACPIEYPFPVKPGHGRYVDVNGDGLLNTDDRTIIGNAQPDFTWALTNNFSYRNFNLSFLFHGAVGGDFYFVDNRRSMFYHEGRNYLGVLRNRWRSEEEPGDGYHYKLSVDIDGLEKEASSYWITDGTYTRLKDVTLSYTIPPGYAERLGLSGSRIYINGTNLFTIQNTSAVDPENFSGAATDAASVGVQHSPYPTAKTFSLGLNVNF